MLLLIAGLMIGIPLGLLCIVLKLRERGRSVVDYGGAYDEPAQPPTIYFPNMGKGGPGVTVVPGPRSERNPD